MIRVVQLIQISAHPSVAALKVCQVTDGKDEITVVCGASNVREGMKTILAGVGDTLPSGATLQAIQLGGVESRGMLCSSKDLGLSTESGVVDLPDDIALGGPLDQVAASLLSSVPWHSYRKVDSLYWNPSTKGITVVRPGEKSPRDCQLISQSYFHRGRYHYRNFSLQQR